MIRESVWSVAAIMPFLAVGRWAFLQDTSDGGFAIDLGALMALALVVSIAVLIWRLQHAIHRKRFAWAIPSAFLAALMIASWYVAWTWATETYVMDPAVIHTPLTGD